MTGLSALRSEMDCPFSEITDDTDNNNPMLVTMPEIGDIIFTKLYNFDAIQ